MRNIIILATILAFAFVIAFGVSKVFEPDKPIKIERSDSISSLVKTSSALQTRDQTCQITVVENGASSDGNGPCNVIITELQGSGVYSQKFVMSNPAKASLTFDFRTVDGSVTALFIDGETKDIQSGECSMDGEPACVFTEFGGREVTVESM